MSGSRPRPALFLALLAAIGIALFSLFVALGQWQVERRAWKLARVVGWHVPPEQLRRTRAVPCVTLSGTLRPPPITVPKADGGRL